MPTPAGAERWRLSTTPRYMPIDDTTAPRSSASSISSFLAPDISTTARGPPSTNSQPLPRLLPVFKSSSPYTTLKPLDPLSEFMMVLLIAFLLFSICILLIFAFHLWRRSAILEEALRSVSPATYTSLKTKSARSSPPLYALDVEYTAATPPPPYSLDPGIQTTESKPQRRSTVATHETSNYDYLDCDCYDGDSWASLPAEECRCLRAQKTMSL